MSLLCASAPAWSTTIYKWVDEAGVVHFSDTPNPKAQKIEVGSAQSYAAPATLPGASSTQAADSRIPVTVSTCTIDAPAADQVFQDTFAVSGHVTFSPALRPGEMVVVTLDGAPSGAANAGGGFSLSVERGSHTVSVTVQGADGQAHCQSAPVTFHVRQQSLVAPAAPTAPGVLNPSRPH